MSMLSFIVLVLLHSAVASEAPFPALNDRPYSKYLSFDSSYPSSISSSSFSMAETPHFSSSFTSSSSTGVYPLPERDLQYHGTTTLALVVGDTVVVAADSMASIGSYVGSRTVKKIFPLSRHVVATMAGGAADCAYWLRSVAARMRILEFELGGQLEPRCYATLLARSLREYRGSGISVGTMVAGWHPSCGPSLHYVDSEGACVGGRRFCVGSGAALALSVLDTTLPLSAADSGTEGETGAESLERAVDAAVRAVRHATYRDSYSGGFINVLLVDSDGCRHVRRVDARTLPINS